MIAVVLVHYKDTPQKHRYDAPEGNDAPLQSIYIRKGVLGKKPPHSICVTVRGLEA